MFAIATSLAGEYHYEFDNYCRFLRYVEGQWIMTEIGDRIASMIRYQAPGWKRPGLVTMSWSGQVVFLGDTVWEEHIPDAGIDDGNGYINRIVDIDGVLFTCGDMGQIFRRMESGEWVHTDNGTYSASGVSVPEEPSRGKFFSINTIASIDFMRFYAAGNATASIGLLFTRAQNDPWQRVPLPDGTKWLLDIAIEDEETIFLSTRGHILKGNLQSGFAPVPFASPADRNPHNPDITALAFYKGHLHSADGAGICRLDSDGLHRLEGFDNRQIGPHTLQVSDGYLWVFGYRGVARFDGTIWKYYHPPRLSSDPNSDL
ncbi:hypothetical protein [Martelella mangrovi]|uniref:Uncharacterized protein n=1 Tax=Martelella mangrovi TaxID=1397477 RepID=A0ABV2IG34_9HYPH